MNIGKIDSDIEKKLMVTSGMRKKETHHGVGIKRYKLLCIELNKLQGYIVQQRQYSQYFTLTINGV